MDILSSFLFARQLPKTLHFYDLFSFRPYILIFTILGSVFPSSANIVQKKKLNEENG